MADIKALHHKCRKTRTIRFSAQYIINRTVSSWLNSTFGTFDYRTCAIISRSWFEAALVYKPQILSLKNEEFPFLVYKLSAIYDAAKVKIG